MTRSGFLISGALAIVIVGYALVYVPMRRNFDDCGKVTLCNQSDARP
jgi:hypothetical protein